VFACERSPACGSRGTVVSNHPRPPAPGLGFGNAETVHPIAEVLKIAFADQGELPEPLRPYFTPKRGKTRTNTVLARDLLAHVLELTRN